MEQRWKFLLELSKDISGRWTIPILLSISLNGDRFTPLQTKTGAAPARLSENLKRMCQAGLIKHISPYERRHPLLPEYILTEKGVLYREAAIAINKAAERINSVDLLYKQWNLPIMFSILNNKDRFQEIKNELQIITPKMLSGRLSMLKEQNMVDKAILSVTPIISSYSLTGMSYKPIKNLAADILSII